MAPGGRNMEITLCWAGCLLVGERLVSGSTRTLRDTRSLQCVTTGNTKAACRSGAPGSELNKLGVNPDFGRFLPSGLFDKPPLTLSSLHILSSRLSSSLGLFTCSSCFSSADDPKMFALWRTWRCRVSSPLLCLIGFSSVSSHERNTDCTPNLVH